MNITKLRGLFTETFVTMSVVVLVILSTAMETDIFVPSFPAIKEYFSTSEALVQMIISLNFLGLCIGSLFYGPLSDTYGRRPILLVGMSIFCFSSIACVLTTSIETLLFWRFIQGLGSSVAFVVPGAIIYDVLERELAAKMLGIYHSIITLAMSFAPIIGSYLYITFDWRANFIFVAAVAGIAFLSALFFIKEPHHVSLRSPLHFPMILKGFQKLLVNREAMSNVFIICAGNGAYFAYITNLSFIFINNLGMENEVYAYYQAAILLIFAAMSFISGLVITYIGGARTRMWSKGIALVGACSLLLVAIFAPGNALLITLAMGIYTAGFAMALGVLYGDYMAVYPGIRGIASSLSNCLKLLAMSLTVALSSAIFNGTILPVAIIVFVAGVACFLVMLTMRFKEN